MALDFRAQQEAKKHFYTILNALITINSGIAMNGPTLAGQINHIASFLDKTSSTNTETLAKTNLGITSIDALAVLIPALNEIKAIAAKDTDAVKEILGGALAEHVVNYEIEGEFKLDSAGTVEKYFKINSEKSTVLVKDKLSSRLEKLNEKDGTFISDNLLKLAKKNDIITEDTYIDRAAEYQQLLSEVNPSLASKNSSLKQASMLMYALAPYSGIDPITGIPRSADLQKELAADVFKAAVTNELSTLKAKENKKGSKELDEVNKVNFRGLETFIEDKTAFLMDPAKVATAVAKQVAELAKNQQPITNFDWEEVNLDNLVEEQYADTLNAKLGKGQFKATPFDMDRASITRIIAKTSQLGDVTSLEEAYALQDKQAKAIDTYLRFYNAHPEIKAAKDGLKAKEQLREQLTTAAALVANNVDFNEALIDPTTGVIKVPNGYEDVKKEVVAANADIATNVASGIVGDLKARVRSNLKHQYGLTKEQINAVNFDKLDEWFEKHTKPELAIFPHPERIAKAIYKNQVRNKDGYTYSTDLTYDLLVEQKHAENLEVKLDEFDKGAFKRNPLSERNKEYVTHVIAKLSNLKTTPLSDANALILNQRKAIEAYMDFLESNPKIKNHKGGVATETQRREELIKITALATSGVDVSKDFKKYVDPNTGVVTIPGALADKVKAAEKEYLAEQMAHTLSERLHNPGTWQSFTDGVRGFYRDKMGKAEDNILSSVDKNASPAKKEEALAKFFLELINKNPDLDVSKLETPTLSSVVGDIAKVMKDKGMSPEITTAVEKHLLPALKKEAERGEFLEKVEKDKQSLYGLDKYQRMAREQDKLLDKKSIDELTDPGEIEQRKNQHRYLIERLVEKEAEITKKYDGKVRASTVDDTITVGFAFGIVALLTLPFVPFLAPVIVGVGAAIGAAYGYTTKQKEMEREIKYEQEKVMRDDRKAYFKAASEKKVPLSPEAKNQLLIDQFNELKQEGIVTLSNGKSIQIPTEKDKPYKNKHHTQILGLFGTGSLDGALELRQKIETETVTKKIKVTGSDGQVTEIDEPQLVDKDVFFFKISLHDAENMGLVERNAEIKRVETASGYKEYIAPSAKLNALKDKGLLDKSAQCEIKVNKKGEKILTLQVNISPDAEKSAKDIDAVKKTTAEGFGLAGDGRKARQIQEHHLNAKGTKITPQNTPTPNNKPNPEQSFVKA